MSQNDVLKSCPVCCSDRLIQLSRTPTNHVYKCLNCGSSMRLTSSEEDRRRILNANYVKLDLKDKYNQERKNYHQYLYNLIKQFSKNNQGAILDIGANYGQLLKIFRDNNWQAFAIEPNQNCLANLRDLNIKSEASLDDLLAQDNLKNKFFDVITIIDTLYYIDQPTELLKQCYKILKPGGIVLLRTYHRSYFLFLRLIYRQIIDFVYGDSKIDFTSKGLRLVGQRAGFSKENIKILGEPGWVRKTGGLRLFYDALRILGLSSILGPGIITIMRK